jgi:ubiquinone biosynthesis protein
MTSYKGGVVRSRIRRLKKIVSLIHKYDIASYFVKIPFSSPFRRFKKLKGIDDEPIQVRIRMLMEELGPTFVKIGQILSTQYDHLPAEFCEELSKLQNGVQPFESETAKQIVEEELNAKISDMFSEFGDEPVASASLSQVHKARLKSGELVAVKVQRPGIKEVIETDFDLLFYLSKYFDKRIKSVMNLDVNNLLNEARTVIIEELDFTKEIDNIDRFYENNKTDKKIKVPKTYSQFSSTKVITMEFIDGVKITEIDKIRNMGLDPDIVIKDFVAATYKQMLVHGFFHGDPHPANVLVVEDGSLAFLDFGVMGKLNKHMRQGYIDQTKALSKGDSRAYITRYAQTHNFDVNQLDMDSLEQRMDLMLLDFFEDRVNSYGEFLFNVTQAMSEKIPMPHAIAVLVRSMMATSSIMKMYGVSNTNSLALFMQAHLDDPENRKELLESTGRAQGGITDTLSLKSLIDPFGLFEGFVSNMVPFMRSSSSTSERRAQPSQPPVTESAHVSRVIPESVEPESEPEEAAHFNEELTEEISEDILDEEQEECPEEYLDEEHLDEEVEEVEEEDLDAPTPSCSSSVDKHNSEIESLLGELKKVNSTLRK